MPNACHKVNRPVPRAELACWHACLPAAAETTAGKREPESSRPIAYTNYTKPINRPRPVGGPRLRQHHFQVFSASAGFPQRINSAPSSMGLVAVILVRYAPLVGRWCALWVVLVGFSRLTSFENWILDVVSVETLAWLSSRRVVQGSWSWISTTGFLKEVTQIRFDNSAESPA